jgi:hypothetical protein
LKGGTDTANEKIKVGKGGVITFVDNAVHHVRGDTRGGIV